MTMDALGHVPANPRIRILLADGQLLFREAILSVLESEPGMEVVGEAGRGYAALAEARRSRPDVAIVGAELEACEGLRAVALMKEQVPSCLTLVVVDSESQESLLEALEAGARGYLCKVRPVSDLIQATRAIFRGETVVPPLMLGPLLSRILRMQRQGTTELHALSRLTPREREVLALLADGGDNVSIARALLISPETARTHIQKVLNKLGVHSRLEAAAFLARAGIRSDLVSSA